MSATTPASSLYELLSLSPTATLEEVRAAYKDKALLHHPDRGGDPFQWAQIQQAYDTLSDQARRTAYDRTRRAAAGGVEEEFAQKFSDGAFDLSDGGSAPERKAADASSMNIVEKMAQVKQDEARANEAQRGAIATKTGSMSHSAGFDAWLRNQRGLGKHGFYNAEDLLRKSKALGGGIEATDASSVPLPPLSTLAVRFTEHGPPEDVLAIERELALPEKLRHGEVCRRRRPAPEKLGPAVPAAVPSSQPTRPAPDAPAR